jgi:alpha-glucosidase (family GH31 glycosyl hydrolase)
LVFSITNLLNFNMFGIPNVGTNLGGYYVTTDEELYVRYFQLAVVSPIAYFNDDTPTL